MASNRKNEEAKSSPFGGLGAKLEERGAKLKEGGFVRPKGLQPLSLSHAGARAELEERKKFVEKEMETLLPAIREMAEVLADEDAATHFRARLDGYEDKIVEFLSIGNIPEDWSVERDELIRATMVAMAENYPSTGDALRRIAGIGLLLGALVEASEKTRDSQVAYLPVAGEDGRWRQMRLTSHHPGSRGLIPALRKKGEESFAGRQKKRETDLEKLREGANKTLLEALRDGAGDAVFFAPDRRNDGGHFIPGGHVRVRVSGGTAELHGAVGKVARRVREIVNAGTRLPVEQLKRERLDLGYRVEEEEFRNLLTIHALVRTGMKRELHAVQMQEKREEMRKQATADTRDFLLSDLSEKAPEKTACLYLRSWTTNRGREGEWVHRNVEFVVERNSDGEIRVLECLPQHEELFSKCREFADEQTASYPLPQMLGKIRGILAHHDERAADEESRKSNEASNGDSNEE